MAYLHPVVLLLLSILVAWAVAKACAARWQGNFKKLLIFTSLIITACTALSWLTNGLGLCVIQTIILSALFCYISYSDIKDRRASDHLHIMVLITAMMDIAGDQLPVRATTSLVVGVAMLLIALIPRMELGGADIKFSAACAFLMPPPFFIFGMCLGLFLSLISNLPFIRKGAAQGYPLLPYLSLGVMFAFLVSK